jgi:hypothetical protein
MVKSEKKPFSRVYFSKYYLKMPKYEKITLPRVIPFGLTTGDFLATPTCCFRDYLYIDRNFIENKFICRWNKNAPTYSHMQMFFLLILVTGNASVPCIDVYSTNCAKLMLDGTRFLFIAELGGIHQYYIY